MIVDKMRISSMDIAEKMQILPNDYKQISLKDRIQTANFGKGPRISSNDRLKIMNYTKEQQVKL